MASGNLQQIGHTALLSLGLLHVVLSFETCGVVRVGRLHQSVAYVSSELWVIALSIVDTNWLEYVLHGNLS